MSARHSLFYSLRLVNCLAHWFAPTSPDSCSLAPTDSLADGSAHGARCEPNSRRASTAGRSITACFRGRICRHPRIFRSLASWIASHPQGSAPVVQHRRRWPRTLCVRRLTFGTCTALAFGLVPAWRMSKSDPATALRDFGVTTTSGRHRQPASPCADRVAQTALGFTLLIGAGLLIRSLFQHVIHIDPGFDGTLPSTLMSR